MIVSRVSNLEDIRLRNAFGARATGNFLDINPVDETLASVMLRAGWQGTVIRIEGADTPAPVSVPERVDWVRLGLSGWSTHDMLSWTSRHLPDISVLLVSLGEAVCPPELEAMLVKRGLERVLFDGVSHIFAATNDGALRDGLCRPLNEDRCAIFPVRAALPVARPAGPRSTEAEALEQLQTRLASAETELSRLQKSTEAARFTPRRILRALKRRLDKRARKIVSRTASPQRAELIEALDLSHEDAIAAWSGLLAEPDRD